MSGAIGPILLANVEKGNLTSLKALLDGRTRGAALTALLDARLEAANEFTLLAYAAWHGQADAVRLLLESGASVGATSGSGSTALFIACQKGQLECARLVLGAGAAVNKAMDDGATPLFILRTGMATSSAPGCFSLLARRSNKPGTMVPRRCTLRAATATSRTPGCSSAPARRSTKPSTTAPRR